MNETSVCIAVAVDGLPDNVTSGRPLVRETSVLTFVTVDAPAVTVTSGTGYTVTSTVCVPPSQGCVDVLVEAVVASSACSVYMYG